MTYFSEGKYQKRAAFLFLRQFDVWKPDRGYDHQLNLKIPWVACYLKDSVGDDKYSPLFEPNVSIPEPI